MGDNGEWTDYEKLWRVSRAMTRPAVFQPMLYKDSMWPGVPEPGWTCAIDDIYNRRVFTANGKTPEEAAQNLMRKLEKKFKFTIRASPAGLHVWPSEICINEPAPSKPPVAPRRRRGRA